jgi:hypothetical protein
MKINEYFNKKNQYPMMEDFNSIGNVVDTERSNELFIGVRIHRDVYSQLGYYCNEGAPELLHACVCAMFEIIFEMPIIKTVLLTPKDVLELLCEEDEVTEEMKRYAAMALFALREAFAGYLSERNK